MAKNKKNKKPPKSRKSILKTAKLVIENRKIITKLMGGKNNS